jgi:hypothetical protein
MLLQDVGFYPPLIVKEHHPALFENSPLKIAKA